LLRREDLSFPRISRDTRRGGSDPRGGSHGSLKKPKKKRKKHAEEFKREAVSNCLKVRGERTVADVSGEPGRGRNLLHAWKKDPYGNAAEQ
jgi:hypothetical protein